MILSEVVRAILNWSGLVDCVGLLGCRMASLQLTLSEVVWRAKLLI